MSWKRMIPFVSEDNYPDVRVSPLFTAFPLDPTGGLGSPRTPGSSSCLLDHFLITIGKPAPHTTAWPQNSVVNTHTSFCMWIETTSFSQPINFQILFLKFKKGPGVGSSRENQNARNLKIRLSKGKICHPSWSPFPSRHHDLHGHVAYFQCYLILCSEYSVSSHWLLVTRAPANQSMTPAWNKIHQHLWINLCG